MNTKTEETHYYPFLFAIMVHQTLKEIWLFELHFMLNG